MSWKAGIGKKLKYLACSVRFELRKEVVVVGSARRLVNQRVSGPSTIADSEAGSSVLRHI